MSPSDLQSWGSWAIQVEELAGVRIHGDIVEDAMDAWQTGVSPADFAERMVREHCDGKAPAGVDRREQPFTQADDPSSPLLAGGAGTLAVILLGTLIGYALAPHLRELFL